MTALSDSALHSLANGGAVNPYNLNHLSPSSIDLTLGDTIQIESLDDSGNGWVEINIDTPYSLRPGQFVLGHTAEWIEMPLDCLGMVILRSSAARAGYDHAMAGLIDPGFCGEITLELSNKLQLHTLELQTGKRLVQLVMFKLDKEPFKPYGLTQNSYMHQSGPTLSSYSLGSK